MTVYLVLDASNLEQHELVEVWATEDLAKARVVELNDRDGLKGSDEPMELEPWFYDEREVRTEHT